jgi:hypothetical protein
MKKTLVPYLFLVLTFVACFNDFDDELSNPVQQETPTAEFPITVGSELYNNLQSYIDNENTNPTDCIEFIYPITINVFDELLDFVNFQTIENKDNFIQFLASLQIEYTISISYPIIYTNDTGEEIQIENNEQLGEKLQECLDIELEIYCNNILIGEIGQECIWKVINNPNGNNDYENAIFNLSPIGLTTLEHNDTVVFGSWNVLASFNQLFFNISFEANTDASIVWNKNWYVTIIDENNIMLQDGNSEVFFLEKECGLEICPKYIFEECEIEIDSNVSNFDLESYINCFASNLDLSNSTVTFFETEMDATNNLNQILSPYTNILNLKYIYVRIADNTTGEFSILKILLVVINC